MLSMGFDVKVVPTVTAGPYSANDVVGGLLTFPVGRGPGGDGDTVIIKRCVVALKAAITSTLTVHLFDAAPATIADNGAYTLGTVADVFKYVGTLTGFATVVDHGTPNSYALNAIDMVVRPADGKTIYGYLVDGTGFTPASTSDVQIRLTGEIL